AYRVFADFTPAATGRGLYASADLQIAEESSGPKPKDVGKPGNVADPTGRDSVISEVAIEGYRFALRPAVNPIRAAQAADLRFVVTREGSGPVPLEPVMGAFAHLVAFDQGRSGFAHLHPLEIDLRKPP